MNLTNIHGLPDALVNAIKNDPYTGGGDISVTKLIDSPQLRVLRKKYAKLVVEDVSDRIWALMGQAVHTVLERAGTSALVEERLYATVDGWSVSGQFDRLHLEDGVLQDWKVCSTYKAGGDVSWERQLNCLRWLAHKNGYEVQRLQVIAIFRDWKPSEAKRNPDYPQRNVATIEIPVWNLADAEAYVSQRVMLHKSAEHQDNAGDSEVPQCTEEERWYAGTTYALMKDGGKRAKRVSPVRSDLEPVPTDHYIEERPGANRRCEGYCEVAPFCPQYKRIQEQQQAQQSEVATNDVDF